MHFWSSDSFCSKSLRLETHDGFRTGAHICMAVTQTLCHKLRLSLEFEGLMQSFNCKVSVFMGLHLCVCMGLHLPPLAETHPHRWLCFPCFAFRYCASHLYFIFFIIMFAFSGGYTRGLGLNGLGLYSGPFKQNKVQGPYIRCCVLNTAQRKRCIHRDKDDAGI